MLFGYCNLSMCDIVCMMMLDGIGVVEVKLFMFVLNWLCVEFFCVLYCVVVRFVLCVNVVVFWICCVGVVFIWVVENGCCWKSVELCVSVCVVLCCWGLWDLFCLVVLCGVWFVWLCRLCVLDVFVWVCWDWRIWLCVCFRWFGRSLDICVCWW